MTAKTEIKNFIDHHGLRDTLDALDEYLAETNQQGTLQEWGREAVKEFVEQQIFYFGWDI